MQDDQSAFSVLLLVYLCMNYDKTCIIVMNSMMKTIMPFNMYIDNEHILNIQNAKTKTEELVVAWMCYFDNFVSVKNRLHYI